MTLLAIIHECGLTERLAINLLTDARIISDQCVNVHDVAEPDLTRAIVWLRERFGEEPKCPKCGSPMKSFGQIGLDKHGREMEADWDECTKCDYVKWE